MFLSQCSHRPLAALGFCGNSPLRYRRWLLRMASAACYLSLIPVVRNISQTVPVGEHNQQQTRLPA